MKGTKIISNLKKLIEEEEHFYFEQIYKEMEDTFFYYGYFSSLEEYLREEFVDHFDIMACINSNSTYLIRCLKILDKTWSKTDEAVYWDEVNRQTEENIINNLPDGCDIYHARKENF